MANSADLVISGRIISRNPYHDDDGFAYDFYTALVRVWYWPNLIYPDTVRFVYPRTDRLEANAIATQLDAGNSRTEFLLGLQTCSDLAFPRLASPRHIVAIDRATSRATAQGVTFKTEELDSLLAAGTLPRDFSRVARSVDAAVLAVCKQALKPSTPPHPDDTLFAATSVRPIGTGLPKAPPSHLLWTRQSIDSIWRDECSLRPSFNMQAGDTCLLLLEWTKEGRWRMANSSSAILRLVDHTYYVNYGYNCSRVCRRPVPVADTTDVHRLIRLALDQSAILRIDSLLAAGQYDTVRTLCRMRNGASPWRSFADLDHRLSAPGAVADRRRAGVDELAYSIWEARYQLQKSDPARLTWALDLADSLVVLKSRLYTKDDIEIAETLLDRGYLEYMLDSLCEARASFLTSARIARENGRDSRNRPASVCAAAEQLYALVCCRVGEFEEALDWSTQALKTWEATAGIDNLLAMNARNTRASALFNLGKLNEATEELIRTADLLEPRSKWSRLQATVLNNLGRVWVETHSSAYRDFDVFNEAIAIAMQDRSGIRDSLQTEFFVQNATANRGFWLSEKGDWRGAVQTWVHVAENVEDIAGRENPIYAKCCYGMALALSHETAEERRDDARILAQSAVSLLRAYLTKTSQCGRVDSYDLRKYEDFANSLGPFTHKTDIAEEASSVLRRFRSDDQSSSGSSVSRVSGSQAGMRGPSVGL